jgi:transcriptional regulator with XRE-family HTH domain
MNELRIVRKIRQIRLQSKLTLQTVADRTGFTKSYLSMVESGKKSPPIATLSKIANALGVDMAAFFEQKKPEDRITLVKKGKGKLVVRNASAFGYRYKSLAPTKKLKRMEPFISTNLPEEKDDDSTWFDHEGEEFLYLLEGKMKFFYGDKEYVLEEGDCIYFDSSIPHRGQAMSNKPTKALLVISQPGYPFAY